MTKERRTFTPEFKQQMVQRYQNGKPRKAIIREYELHHLPWIHGLSKAKPQAR